MKPNDALTALGAVALVVALAGAGVAFADLGADTPGTTGTDARATTDHGSTIQVTATGEAEARPDAVRIRLQVSSTAKNATAARTRVAENVTALREALYELGLEDDQIRTADFNLYEDEPHPREERERGTVYRVRHALRIELSDIERTGQVLDAAIESGATDIHDVQFTLSDETRSEMREEALEDAMGDARSQADVIAGSADLEIASVDRIRTSEARGPVRPMAFEAAANVGGGTDVQSGPVTVTATVSVSYNATG